MQEGEKRTQKRRPSASSARRNAAFSPFLRPDRDDAEADPAPALRRGVNARRAGADRPDLVIIAAAALHGGNRPDHRRISAAEAIGGARLPRQLELIGGALLHGEIERRVGLQPRRLGPAGAGRRERHGRAVRRLRRDHGGAGPLVVDAEQISVRQLFGKRYRNRRGIGGNGGGILRKQRRDLIIIGGAAGLEGVGGGVAPQDGRGGGPAHCPERNDVISVGGGGGDGRFPRALVRNGEQIAAGGPPGIGDAHRRRIGGDGGRHGRVVRCDLIDIAIPAVAEIVGLGVAEKPRGRVRAAGRRIARGRIARRRVARNRAAAGVIAEAVVHVADAVDPRHILLGVLPHGVRHRDAGRGNPARVGDPQVVLPDQRAGQMRVVEIGKAIDRRPVPRLLDPAAERLDDLAESLRGKPELALVLHIVDHGVIHRTAVQNMEAELRFLRRHRRIGRIAVMIGSYLEAVLFRPVVIILEILVGLVRPVLAAVAGADHGEIEPRALHGGPDDGLLSERIVLGHVDPPGDDVRHPDGDGAGPHLTVWEFGGDGGAPVGLPRHVAPAVHHDGGGVRGRPEQLAHGLRPGVSRDLDGLADLQVQRRGAQPVALLRERGNRHQQGEDRGEEHRPQFFDQSDSSLFHLKAAGAPAERRRLVESGRFTISIIFFWRLTVKKIMENRFWKHFPRFARRMPAKRESSCNRT